MTHMTPASNDEPITGVILAGGQGRRMGGVDKGLQDLHGRPMVQWVIDRLAPQVAHLLINANRNLERYAELGYPVIADEIPDYAGPLAGIQMALTHAATLLVAIVPCDSPSLPGDLVARLARALQENCADLAVARTIERTHPVFCLTRRSLLPQLNDYLARGNRQVTGWHALLKTCDVLFDDSTGAFSNLNTAQALAHHIN